jgi:hypothetical protein
VLHVCWRNRQKKLKATISSELAVKQRTIKEEKYEEETFEVQDPPGGRVDDSESSMLDVKCVTRKLWSEPMSKSFSARMGNLLVRFLYSRPETGTLPDPRKASYSPMFLGKGVGKGWPSSCAHSPADLSTTLSAEVYWWWATQTCDHISNIVHRKDTHAKEGCL